MTVGKKATGSWETYPERGFRRWSRWAPGGPAIAVVVLLVALVLVPGLMGHVGIARADTVTFTAQECLGKPTNNSITINVVPASNVQYYYRYGTSSGNYTGQSATVNATGGQPSELTITGLSADTKYYYQMVYDGDGSVTDGDFETGTEHSFHTARASGDPFTFSITTDGHAQGTGGTYSRILSELPDFNIDMGDTFMTDGVSSQSSANSKYLAQRTSSTMGTAGVSVPLFVMPGNHEQEEGWHFSDGQALASIQARKLFFPTPVPGGSFYTGNTDTLSSISAATYGDQYREDYYAWTWGDALFIVIDPFQYTPNDPYGNVAGDGGTQTGDQWSWSLGKQQYDWLKSTLEGSSAKYKFIFSHNMVGGCTHSESGSNYPGYVRGGAECAAYFEWGGYTTGTNSYDFDTKRSGWGEPIEQLLIENHVSAYFHGHDHQFAYETRDGIVYQECPPAGTMSGFSGCYTQGVHTDPAGSYDTISVQSINSAHLRVSVTSSEATVDLINSSGSVAYTYNIDPYVSGTTHQLNMAVGTGSGTTTPSVGAHSYTEGTVVNISATPAVGYIFNNWTGGVTGTTNPTTVTMSGDKTVTANFTAQNYNLTMAASPSGGGTTTPAVGVTSEPANQVVNITATPASGYQFTGWSGTGVTSPSSASTTVTVDAAKTVTANFSVIPAGAVVIDGAVDTGTGAPTASSLSFAHTTGTGNNRLLLVGVSWNCGSTDRAISSVTFTPSGQSALPMTEVMHQLTDTTSAPRYSAVYKLVAPPSGAPGTVIIIFAGAVANGAIAGATNFANVNQATPLGTAVGAASTDNTGTAVTVNLTGLSGNELLFDNVFMGSSASGTTLTPDAGQTQRWSINGYGSATNFNSMGGASTKQATGSTATMSWTGSASAWWATVAVPIRPASTSTYTINLAVGWNLVAATPGTTGFPASLFGWTGSAYQSVADPASWSGYWCKATSTGTVTVTPTTGPKTINLTTGWNLIGNSMGTVATLTLPSGRSAFVYDTSSKSYVSTTSLQPGQGAWVKGVNSGETAVLTGS